MKKFLFLFLIPVAFATCKKDDNLENPPNDVFYQSINHFLANGNNVQGSFDLDGDSIIDLGYFNLYFDNSFDSLGNQVEYVYDFKKLEAIHSGFSFAVYRDTSLTLFNRGDKIPVMAQWENRIELVYNEYWTYSNGSVNYEHNTDPFQDSNGEGYVLIRYQEGGNNYYGWMFVKTTSDGFLLHSWALNNQPDQPILIGYLY